MLSNIHIENIAVIKNIDIEFGHGFCAITGETGAGKTVIMDAIKLLVGAKTDRELIRHGEERAQISGLFSDIGEDVQRTLCDMGYECEDGELLVSRTISADGRSSVKINGKSATASMQRSIVGSLLDFHGQHDNVTLLDKKTHLRMLDEYADTASELASYKEKYAEYTDAKRKLSSFIEQSKDKQRQLELLTAQIKDISAVKPKVGEEQKLEAERLRLSNIEKVRKQAGFAYRAIYGGEKGNACMLIDKSIGSLSALSEAVPEFAELSARLRNVYYELGDIAEAIGEYADDGEDPTAALDKIESRLDAIRKLKKKYGADIEEILAFYEKAKKKAGEYENSDLTKEELERDYNARLGELSVFAEVLSEKRRRAAEQLSEGVCEVLSFLDMPKVRFEARVSEPDTGKKNKESAYSPDGADDVVFLMALSSGEPMLELSNASGGELARVMLALKSVLCQRFGAQTVIYDEIDAGVSGRTARKIGMKLKQSAKNAQVICVTHSAQIASLADVHYKICKNTSDGRFESDIRELDREGRIEELSRILGGLSVTQAQRQAAEDMLNGESGLL